MKTDESFGNCGSSRLVPKIVVYDFHEKIMAERSLRNKFSDQIKMKFQAFLAITPETVRFILVGKGALQFVEKHLATFIKNEKKRRQALTG